MSPPSLAISKQKKQHTVWHWISMAGEKDIFRIGVIYNKKDGVREDIIRVEFLSSKPGHGWTTNMRVDEAMHLIAGLSKTLARLMWGGKRQATMFVKSAKMNVDLKDD